MSIQNILQEITDELKTVNGVESIVLGGSRARGTNTEDADIDIGIYYDEETFKAEMINGIATKLDDEHRENIVSSLGEWGPWINGGAWIIVQGYHVDLIFRDMNKVQNVIDDCLNGKITSHYHTGHPHAFINAIYMGEVAIAQILYDSKNKISTLKEKTIPYPKPMQEAIIGYFIFEAKFSLMFAKENSTKDEISYVMGHCFRSISCLNQVLFALNEEYCLNEKKAVKMVQHFNQKPENYKEKIDHIVTLLSTDIENTEEAIRLLENLIAETEELIQ